MGITLRSEEEADPGKQANVVQQRDKRTGVSWRLRAKTSGSIGSCVWEKGGGVRRLDQSARMVLITVSVSVYCFSPRKPYLDNNQNTHLNWSFLAQLRTWTCGTTVPRQPVKIKIAGSTP